MRTQNGTSTLANSSEVSNKFSITLPYEPAVIPSGIYSKEVKVQTKLCRQLFIATVFITVRN